MQIIEIIYQILAYAAITGFVTAWLLYRRLSSPVRSSVRVHYVGGTEKRYNAAEIERELVWIQAGEEKRADIPEIVQPGHDKRFGVHYRVYDFVDGADEVMQVPWHMPKEWRGYVQGDAAAKQRYRSRVNALGVLKQLAAGLATMSRMQIIIIFGFGWFAGAYIMPIIAEAIL